MTCEHKRLSLHGQCLDCHKLPYEISREANELCPTCGQPDNCGDCDHTPCGPTVHTFGSTGEAYDASQCDDDIKDGDVLSVPSERVVGVLLQAWPVAVSEEHGEFHTLGDPGDWSAIPCFDNSPGAGVDSPPISKDYSGSYAAAVEELARISAPPENDRRRFGLTEATHYLRLRLEDAERNGQDELATRLRGELQRRGEN